MHHFFSGLMCTGKREMGEASIEVFEKLLLESGREIARAGDTTERDGNGFIHHQLISYKNARGRDQTSSSSTRGACQPNPKTDKKLFA